MVDDGAAARAELADIEARLADVAELFAAGEITCAEWMRARARLEERRTAAQVEVAVAVAPSPLAAYQDGGELRRAWPKLNLDQRRAIVAAAIEAVVIAPAARRGGRVDLSRVDVRWRA